ncbi:lysostaphin resistance A-like protein [Salinivirga cyanobacteriivorans]
MDYHKRPTATQFLVRLLMLLFMMVAGNLIFVGLAAGVSIVVWDYNFFSQPEMLAQISNSSMLPVVRFFQAMQTIGMFLFPGIAWALLYDKPVMRGLDIKKSISTEAIFGTLLMVIVALPMINALAAINEALNLPEWLNALEQNFRSTEARAMEFMEALLNTESIGTLFINLLVIGVLPAISEEVLFRGVLQKEFNRITRKPILSVIIAAIVFAALHYQFFTFLPRVALGVMLGLVYLWSKNLWVPIALHFFNNGLSVLAWFWLSPEQIDGSVDNIGTPTFMWPLAIVSVILLVALMYGLHQHFRKHHHSSR